MMINGSYKRILDLNKLLELKNFFLFGPRATGKTSLIRAQLPDVRVYDLLDADTFARLARRPKLLEEELVPGDSYLVIDEIQKLPSLLDEVQRLIDARKVRFLLTGSSARKLKRGGVNLLGGRAWEAALFPLTFSEISDFDWVTYFNRGGLPPSYLSKYFKEELHAYVSLYLKEEVMAEALTRRIESFARFLDVMALQNGEELSFQNLSSDCGVGAKTVQNYIQILEDTLVGFQVPAYLKTTKRKAITRSKFFFFDIGVVNSLAHRGEIFPKSDLFGRCFEHFLFLEIRAFLSYRRKHLPLQYWRSTSGYEVDCIVGNELAVEFKSTELATGRHLKGLRALMEEQKISKYMLVSLDPEPRVVDGIQIYPWKQFLSELWQDRII